MSKYGGIVSPFFRRKRKSKSEPPSTLHSAASAPSVPSPQDESAPSAPSADSPTGHDGPPKREIVSRSREELINDAYESWHAELQERADAADRSAAKDRGVIDLTHAHPTGSAQFFGHSATRLSSLIRENHALRQARAELMHLQENIAHMEEAHGHAPVTLSAGEITWTELPEPETNELWAQSYEATGELRLDPAEFRRMDDSEAHQQTDDDAHRQTDDDAEAHSQADDAGVVDPRSADVAGENDSESHAEQSSGPDTPPEPEPRQAIVMTEPAIYRGVRMKVQDNGDAVLQLSHKAEVNPAILRALRNHGAPAETIADLRQLAAQSEGIEALLNRLRELGRVYLPGFDYEAKALLGSFSRPERTMLADLEAMEPYIRTSGVMMALAGDEETRRLSAAPLPPGLREDRAPEVERGAGDLDVCELNAVEAAASGRSLVLDCPPGSERLATIASMCADAAASGNSVVVIPSRASSGHALREELERLNLGDLVLDFTDVEAAPRRIRTGLRLSKPDLPENEMLEVRERLVQVRRELTEFVEDLHRQDEDWSVSVHDLLEKLAKLTGRPDAPKTRVRLRDRAVDAVRGNGYKEIQTELARAAKLGAFDPKIAQSAWAKSTISQAADGTRALDETRRLSEITIPAVIGQSSRAAGETGLSQAKTLAEWFEQIDVLDGISESFDVFLPQIFETSAMNMVIATAPKEWRESHGHSMKASDRRRYKKQAQDLVRPGATPRDLHSELKLAQSRRETWRRYATEGGWPSLPDGMSQIRSTKAEIKRDLEALSGYLEGEDFLNLDFADLQERLANLVNDADHMSTLPERNAVMGSLREKGFGPFIDDLNESRVLAENVAAEFDLAYTSSVFEQLIRKSRSLATLGPRDIAQLLTELRELDKKHVDSLPGPVMRAVVNNSRATMQSRRADTLKLDALLERQGIGSLRDVIATYARLVQVSRPIWIVPPTVVAEFIPPMPWADRAIVDIADGASIASVVSPMMRGRQAIVVGDTRRAKVAEREDDAISAFAKVLPVCELPTVRAMHDELSARALVEHGYDGVLQSVPAPPRKDRSRLVVVDGRGVPSASGNGAVEGTKVEVDAVIEAVLDHAMSRPQESLAVITVSPVHAQRVRDALRHTRANSSDLAKLYGLRESLVVADISQAVGLRRDHVILSVGFGKTVHGRVLHSFGQLAAPHGLTGLIDAIEAPRESLTIISSMAPGDIDISRVSTPGPKLLAKLISQADGRGSDVEASSEGDVPPLLEDLAARIEAEGWRTAPNYGTAGSARIPLVVGHDDIPGTWAVAVLLDDDDYVSEPSLRRRDRYRYESLRNRGWKVYQTYSTSLFIDPEGQSRAVIDLIREAYEAEFPGNPVQVPNLSDWDDATWGEVRDDAAADYAVSEKGRDRERSELQPKPRGPRPSVTPGLQLAAYTDDQLDDMVSWIASDGLPRTEAEFIGALRAELGIIRKGGQIDRVLGNVVRRSRLVGIAGHTVAANETSKAQETAVFEATPDADQEPVVADSETGVDVPDFHAVNEAPEPVADDEVDGQEAAADAEVDGQDPVVDAEVDSRVDADAVHDSDSDVPTDSADPESDGAAAKEATNDESHRPVVSELHDDLILDDSGPVLDEDDR